MYVPLSVSTIENLQYLIPLILLGALNPPIDTFEKIGIWYVYYTVTYPRPHDDWGNFNHVAGLRLVFAACLLTLKF